MVYRFRDGFRMSGDAQAVGEALEGIRRGRGGRLQARDVVKAARKKRSVLHRYFEWDDTEAARQYRLHQARYLIRAVVLCPETDDQPFEPVRAFVSTSESEDEPQSFTHICEAMRDEDQCDQVLRRARSELASWRKRYAELREFASVFEAIDTLAVA